jgi:transcriptional regulator with XRE-family HTH domain
MTSLRSLTTPEILLELGQRVRRTRLLENLSQAALAEEAGLGERTLRKLEQGDGVQLSTLIDLLRALHKLDALDSFLPDPGVSPMELLERAGRQRQRASKRRG